MKELTSRYGIRFEMMMGEKNRDEKSEGRKVSLPSSQTRTIIIID